ncbi:MAG: phage terminase small subunit P27 family [Pseudomonadota bacterium]
MGRPSLPANVHLLHGNPSKKSASDLAGQVVRMPVEIPVCPAHLGTEARAEWKRITPHLLAAGLITQLDRAALAAYCQAWGEWAVLEKRVKEMMSTKGADGLIDVTPSGYKQVSAMAQARDRALDRMLRFAKEFGLTPASRIQSTTGQQLALPGVPDDPMENFLSAGAGMPAAS